MIMNNSNNNYRTPDWNLIDEISLNLLEEGVGIYDVLQKALPSVVLSKIDQMNEECTVERLLKMFRIAQLQIQYILKTQAELVEQLANSQNRLKIMASENSKLRREIVSDVETISSLFKCDCCDKLFLRSTFLFEHMKRRHGNREQLDNER